MPPDNCPCLYPRGKLPTRKFAPPPTTIKFPTKIIFPTQANSLQNVLRVNWGKLCVVYEYYNQRITLSKFIFQGCNLRLQILTKPLKNTTKKRTPSTKYLLIFLHQNAKKRKQFLKKLIWTKIQKNFIVNNNNNNKMTLAWCLSSKWPVCRFIVNLTTGRKIRTKLSNVLKTYVF